jgi:hypothetical protein
MAELRVHDFAIAFDGYAAGPQSPRAARARIARRR